MRQDCAVDNPGRINQSRSAWAVAVVSALLTFIAAVVVATDSLSLIPHPAFLDGVIHEGDHGDLHFWKD